MIAMLIFGIIAIAIGLTLLAAIAALQEELKATRRDRDNALQARYEHWERAQILASELLDLKREMKTARRKVKK